MHFERPIPPCACETTSTASSWCEGAVEVVGVY